MNKFVKIFVALNFKRLWWVFSVSIALYIIWIICKITVLSYECFQNYTLQWLDIVANVVFWVGTAYLAVIGIAVVLYLIIFLIPSLRKKFINELKKR